MALAPPAAPALDPPPRPYGPLFVVAPSRRQRPRASIVRFGRFFNLSVLRATGTTAPRGVPAIVVAPEDEEEGYGLDTVCSDSDKFLLDGLAELADASLKLFKYPTRPHLYIRVGRKVKVARLINRQLLPVPGLPGAAEVPPLHPHD